MIAQKWTQLPGMLYRQVRGDCVYIRQQPLSKKRKSTGHFIPCFAILTALWAAISAENTICIPNGNNSSWIVTFRSSTIRDMHRRKEKET